MDVYKRLYKYIKHYKGRLFLGIICLLIVGLINIALPYIIQLMIDKVMVEKNMNLLNILTLGLLAGFFVKGLFNYSQVYLLSGMGQMVVVDIRNDIYRHLQGLSLSFFSRQTTGDLMSRITNDVNIIQQSITAGLSGLILQPIVLIGSVLILFVLNWKLASVSFLLIPLVVYAINKAGQRMRSISNVIQDRISIVTTILQETISSIRIVKAFNMEDEEIKKFKKANKKSLSANIKGVQIRAVINPVVELIVGLALALLLWYGGQEVMAGHMSQGEFIEFLIRLAMVLAPINILNESYTLFQKAAGSSERIFELLDKEEKVGEVEDAVKMPSIKGKVEFKNVSFSYEEGEAVLKDINLRANLGEMVALVGHSGAGKTTLANLIPRFYDVNQGEVLIDGTNITAVTLKSLRKQIGIVPQETILFKGTIAENIAYGSHEKTKEEIIEAAKKANAHEFIIEFKNSYQTEVGERGVSLSGGQRQRIAIARAILTDPRILILDEATSSLDTRSEALVQEALERLMKNRTTFVIAHRLSTIIAADKIAVIEEGEIVELGNHDELIEKQGYYYNLYQKQFHDGS